MIREVTVFISALCGGAVAGFIYDLIRLKRKAIRTKALLIGLEDVAFWILAAILMFVTAYFSSEGEVRIYFLSAALIGVFIYYWLFSRLVIQILTFLVKAVLWPFLFLLRLMKPPAKKFCALVGKGAEKTHQKLQLAGVRMNRRMKSIHHIMRKL
ncbi:MAG: spore cortex biosynthesis protein YabQ [Thermoclostridium sp.]|nr:spore cortex biosynthesis protein YabQ [Thermoclostridium sp.]